MTYHSEPVVRHMVLWAVRKLYSAEEDRDVISLVERGALASASNEERLEYFRYATGITMWFIIPIIPLSVLSLILVETISQGMNVFIGLPIYAIFAPIFVSRTLQGKMAQCEETTVPVEFTTKNLVWALLWWLFAYIAFVGFIVLLLVTRVGY